MALGAGLGTRIPTVKRSAWLQYSALNNSDSENRSYAISLNLNNLHIENQDNMLTDEDTIYGIATEYAFSGFTQIAEMIPDYDEYDEDDFALQLIKKGRKIRSNNWQSIIMSKRLLHYLCV